MVDINDIYNFVQYELNKSQNGSTLNQDEFNLACQWANLEYFKTYYGLPEQYRVGQPQANISYEQTQLIIDKMSRFKQWKGGQNLPVMAVDVDGRAPYPSDYIHYSSIRYNNRSVTILRDDEIGDALTDSITPPTLQYPVCAFFDNFLQFYPVNLGFVDFTYLRLPVTPFWAVTIDAEDNYVYNANASVQFEFDQISLTDIAALILGYAAQNLKDTFSETMAQQRKNSGK